MKITDQKLESALLAEIAASTDSNPLHLQLRGAITADALTVLLFASVLTRRVHPIFLDVAGNALTPWAEASFQRSLLRPVLLPKDFSKGTYELAPNSISIQQSSTGPRCVVIPTEALVCNNAKEFQHFVAQAFRKAEIVLPTELLALVASLGFEASLNAEEHGVVRLGDHGGAGLRVFAALHHENEDYLEPHARQYVRSYNARFTPPEGGWLEMIILDNGMGLAYPGFHVSALQRGSLKPNLYEHDVALEHAQLEKALKLGFTTKGEWGRLFTSQTRPGAGTEVIRMRLASVRGYSALRTGRSVATWSYLESSLSYLKNPLRGDARDNLQPYNISLANPQFLFEGTAWHFVIPLTAQEELPL